MVKIVWDKVALENLIGYQEFIAGDSESRALKWTKEILEKVDLLATFPELGKPVNFRDYEGVRQLTFENHLVFYSVKKDEIKILKFHHSKQLDI